MPAPRFHTFYQYAFLQHVPQHYALLRTLEEPPRRDQQNDEHRGPISAACLFATWSMRAISLRQPL